MEIKIFKNKDIDDFKSWSIWSCEKSEFNWFYDTEEHCYIIEGQVKVKGTENTVNISKGDFVVFPNRYYSGRPRIIHYLFSPTVILPEFGSDLRSKIII